MLGDRVAVLSPTASLLEPEATGILLTTTAVCQGQWSSARSPCALFLVQPPPGGVLARDLFPVGWGLPSQPGSFQPPSHGRLRRRGPTGPRATVAVLPPPCTPR